MNTVRAACLIAFLLSLLLPAAAEIRLPADDCVPGWKQAGQRVCYNGAELFDYIDGGAELFLEFGFERVVIQKYRNDNDEIAIEIYAMNDGEAALGIYLMCCGQETPVVGIGSRNSGDRHQFTVLHGRYMVRVNNFRGRAELMPVMVKLTQQLVSEPAADKKSALLDALPEAGLVAGSLRLLRGPVALQSIYTLGPGDILLQSNKLFAVSGDYRMPDGQTYTTILARYPGPEQALEAYRHVADNLDSYLQIVSHDKQRLVFVDYQQKYGRVEVRDRVLDIKLHLAEKPQ